MDEYNLKLNLWLSCVCAHSPRLIYRCLEEAGTAEEIYHDDADRRRLNAILGQRAEYLDDKGLECADDIIRECAEKDIRIVHISDARYPSLLKDTYMPPNILYMKGEDIDLNKYLCLAVVGTRRCSRDGMEFVNRLSYEIAGEGIVIVSGMAKGMDGAAMRGAVRAGQLTVAVLAGGVDMVYPAVNKDLYDMVLRHGVVISERPPHTIGRPEFYQERNRIIAGISRGVIVTEAPASSGVAITLKYAQEYNRDVFAVPGRPTDPNAYIANALIRDGAVITLSASDVLQEYSWLEGYYLDNGITALKPVMYSDPPEDPYDFPVESRERRSMNPDRKDDGRNNTGTASEPDFEEFDEPDRTILEYLYNSGGTAHIDEIIRDTGLNTVDVSSDMVLLQLKGLVKQSAGNYYSIIV